MKLFYFILSFNLAFSQITFPCNTLKERLMPIDISQYSITSFVNILPYFNFEDKSIKETYILEKFDYGLKIIGRLENIFFDLNSDFNYGMNQYIVEYTCDELLIYFPSINKFWDINTELEININCKLKKDYREEITKIFNFKKTLVLIFPVILVEAENSFSTAFFNMLGENLKNKFFLNKVDFNSKKYSLALYKGLYNYYINNELLSISDHILELNVYNSFLQFYFFNGNDIFNCNSINTNVIFNNFLKVNKEDFSILSEFFKNQKLDITNELVKINYQVLSKEEIDLKRNFHINFIHEEFEKIILADSRETKLLIGFLFLISFLI